MASIAGVNLSVSVACTSNGGLGVRAEGVDRSTNGRCPALYLQTQGAPQCRHLAGIGKRLNLRRPAVPLSAMNGHPPRLLSARL